MTEPTRLLNKNFILLWQGQLVSQLGNQAYAIAMMFWIKHETGSATLMGLIMMVSQIPAVLLGPVGGAFADRHARKAIIVVCDLIDGVVVLALAGTMYLSPDNSGLIVVMLFTVGVIASAVGAFFRPAVGAAIPDIVPEKNLVAANSMNQFSMQASTMIGQGIGGVLYRLLGAPLLILIDGRQSVSHPGRRRGGDKHQFSVTGAQCEREYLLHGIDRRVFRCTLQDQSSDTTECPGGSDGHAGGELPLESGRVS
jgi:MFS family permease